MSCPRLLAERGHAPPGRAPCRRRGSSSVRPVVGAVHDRLDARAGRVRAACRRGRSARRSAPAVRWPGGWRTRSRASSARRRRGRSAGARRRARARDRAWPSRGCRRSLASRRLRVDADVAQEALEHVLGELLRGEGSNAERQPSSPNRRSTSTVAERAGPRLDMLVRECIWAVGRANPVTIAGTRRATREATTGMEPPERDTRWTPSTCSKPSCARTIAGASGST